MKFWISILCFMFLLAACSTAHKPTEASTPMESPAGPAQKSDIDPKSIKPLQPGTDCGAHEFEVQLLAQLVRSYEESMKEKFGRYTSSLAPVLNEIKGHMRYNVAFLQTKEADANAWTFYTPYSGKPDYNQHNLFNLMKLAPYSLIQDNKQKLWIDSRYQTEKYSWSDLKKRCKDCLAHDDKYKTAIYSIHPSGRLDFWTMDQVGNLNHEVDACSAPK